MCGKVFTSQNLLKKHARWHIRVPEEKCTLCDRRFLYKGAVETHLVREKGLELYFYERLYDSSWFNTENFNIF